MLSFTGRTHGNDSTMDDLDRVIAAWQEAGALHEPPRPAMPDQIGAAETALGRPLPDALRRLYEFGNGMGLMGGNLNFDSLAKGASSVVDNGRQLREWGWPIPRDLLMFGDNGAGDLFGVWYPPESRANWRTPVVMVGQIFEPASFALAGTDLAPFLRAWSGYYLQLHGAPAPALDLLGLPTHLRGIDDSYGLTPYFRWADPDLPDPDPDPYERGMDENQLDDLIGWMNLLKPRDRRLD